MHRRLPSLAASLLGVATLLAACSSSGGGGNSGGDPLLSGSPAITTSGPIQVVIEGDSLALTLGIGLSGGQSVYNLHILDDGDLGCGVASGQPIEFQGTPYTYTYNPTTTNPDPDQPPNCPDWRSIWASNIAVAKPDVVAILLGRWEIVDRMHNGQMTNITDPSYAAYLTTQLDAAVKICAAKGARVALMTMPYLQPQYGPGGVQYPETESSRVNAWNAIVRTVAARYPTWVSLIDLNAMLDPGGTYTSTIGPVTVRESDGAHISIPGGEYLAPKILPLLQRLGTKARQAG